MNEDALIDQMLGLFSQLVDSGETIPPEIIQGMSRILESRLGEMAAQPPSAPATPAGADLLWILSGGNRDAFINYLRTIPDPALNQLSLNPVHLNQVINELSRRVTMPHGEVEETIPKAELQSSNVYGFRYNPRDGKLFVRFNNGGIYEYEGVPAQIFKIFASGAIPAKTTGSNEWGQWWRGKIPSLGAAFYEMIREGGYPYQKVA